MTVPKAFVAAVMAFTALLLQVTVIDRLHLPGGQPDLLVLVVICVALTDGPLLGMVLGFASGLAADLVGDHLLGRLALLFTLLGFLAGLARRDDSGGAVLTLAVVLVGSFALSVVNTGVGIVLGGGTGGAGSVLHDGLALAGYDGLLTPFVYPLTRGLMTRADGAR